MLIVGHGNDGWFCEKVEHEMGGGCVGLFGAGSEKKNYIFLKLSCKL